ncbi:MAG: ABC transporter ATP-binding protein [candidate division Zixibacteria bacterium]|nr:ABC transporter ATP-binding protein [candidate division Zixibacteria bacterium]MDD5425603.1 ABC transporter ATP-binding protein [candidate division Zixibacteria bacterium]
MSFLTATGIDKSYVQIKALQAFNLEVNEGEIFALVGPDGAGKTTLLRILCRLIRADRGKAYIAGLDIDRDFESIKSLLGYMPQLFSLYPDLSVEENLKFYAGIYGLTGAAFEKKRDYLYTFSNLGPFADRRAQALSGGMKQKLALSCALMHDPRLLVLDEPTTGVDPLSRHQFWEILKQLKDEGVTILVSTPYMDEVARADHAAFVLNGRKLSEGTPKELAAGFKGQIYFLDCKPSRSLVENLNKFEGLTAQRFGAGLHLYLNENDNLDDYTAYLSQLGINVDTLKPTAPGLEDRFIQLTEYGL